MQKKQCVSWPEVLRINPDHHDYPPTLGKHGALTLVDGKASNGTVGQVFPTILRNNKNSFSYIGHYKISSTVIVPIHIWQGCTMERQTELAEEIESSAWGQKLLMERNIRLNGMSQKEGVQEILELFSKTTKPNLRMNWTVLELVDFRYEEYNALQEADMHTEGGGGDVSTIPTDSFDQARMSWLQSRDLEYLPSSTKPLPRLADCIDSRLSLSSADLSRLSEGISSHAKNSGYADNKYSAPPLLAQLKRYLAATVLELNADFAFGKLRTSDDILRLFEAFHIIYEYNQRSRNGDITPNVADNMLQNFMKSALKPSVSNQNSSKRRQSEGETPPNPSKRPKASPATQHAGALQSGHLRATIQEKGLLRFVLAPAIKEDEDVNTPHEDLYGASPPRLTSRPRKSAGF